MCRSVVKHSVFHSLPELRACCVVRSAPEQPYSIDKITHHLWTAFVFEMPAVILVLSNGDDAVSHKLESP